MAILENFLSSREFTYWENWIFGALELHFQARKSKCPITFLKISVRALHFWIKRWVFIESIWFLIPDNIERVPNRIFRKYKKWSPKWSPRSRYFALIQKNPSSFLLHFSTQKRFLRPRGSILGSIYVCRKLKISKLLQKLDSQLHIEKLITNNLEKTGIIDF